MVLACASVTRKNSGQLVDSTNLSLKVMVVRSRGSFCLDLPRVLNSFLGTTCKGENATNPVCHLLGPDPEDRSEGYGKM